MSNIGRWQTYSFFQDFGALPTPADDLAAKDIGTTTAWQNVKNLPL